MSRKLAGSLLFSLLALGAAEATPVLDEGEAYVRLIAQGSDGYEPHAYVPIRGATDADSAKLVWRLKGKVIASINCHQGDCSYSGTPLKATGEVTADLVFRDDRLEKASVLRTLKFAFRKTGKNHWQVIADDVLGGAWVRHFGATYKEPNERYVRMYMWFTSNDYADNLSARCVVDGTPLEKDIAMGGNSLIDIQATDSKERTFHYRKVEVGFDAYWGPHSRYLDHDPFMLVDHPGAWECRVRRDGRTVRELRFAVTPDGKIQSDEMQSGGNPIPMTEDTAFIDNRLGKDASSLDERFDPAAYKKSLQYGLPWPDHPKVKLIHSALPAKFGPAL